MRNIYSDEAGISQREKVSVVVALIAHPDTQWRPVSDEVANLIAEDVPEQYRQGFAFHVKKLADREAYPGWGMTERYALILKMMEIPQRFQVPLAFGAVKRGTAIKSRPIENLKPFEVDHVYAFILAMTWADKFIRQYCGEDMAQIIAEDHPTMKRFLKRQLSLVRDKPLVLPTQKQPQFEKQSYSAMESNTVERLADEVHFMSREGSPFLQIADACAWGLRRFFSHRDRYGRLYLAKILGENYYNEQMSLQQDAWEHFAGIRVFDLNFPIL